MRVAIAGGTGFLGRALSASLAADGHEVVVLRRGSTQGVDGADGLVNLSGESIAGKRWTAAQKARIRDSRVETTRALADAVVHAKRPPSVFVSGSAVGYYGAHGDEMVTEDTPPGSGFLAGVCVEWEKAAAAASAVTRVVYARTGIVLERDGGALPPMLPPFRFGAGGPVGTGRQFWPWIHRTDWVGMVRWALATSTVSGPMNVTAPAPVTNAEFARALGRALHRPAFVPTPAFALRLLLGEMADALVLSGQRAIPQRAQQAGFSFAYPRLDGALQAIFG
jgi:hypothetical protein